MRALKENARQGFWNGSLPPIGYRTVAAEQRGAKSKKKLEIDPLHADTVRLIYRLALEGDGTTGQMGVKNIVSYLNSRVRNATAIRIALFAADRPALHGLIARTPSHYILDAPRAAHYRLAKTRSP
jgi:hypothetical protein